MTTRYWKRLPAFVREALCAGLVLMHLASVVGFIWTDIPGSPAPGLVESWLRLYQNLSGSFRDYRFFAPSVASDTKAGFLLQNAAGEYRLVNFSAPNREIGFRYSCIIATMRDQRAQDLFARSWAAFLLGNDSTAQKVVVMVKAFMVPTMAEYREGSRPEWRLVYGGEFERTDTSVARR